MSFSELFPKLMGIDWEVFSECLKGPLLGFKKHYSFDRTGELLYVYNATCRLYGLPKFHRTIRCKWKKKEKLQGVIEELNNSFEDISNSEIMSLMVEVSSYDDELKGFVSLENLPVVEPVSVFVNPTKEMEKEAKAKYKEFLKKTKKCILEERKHRKEVKFSKDPEYSEPIKLLLDYVKDQISSPDGNVVDTRPYGNIDLAVAKMTHVGPPTEVPGKILKSGKQGKPWNEYHEKRICTNVEKLCSEAGKFRMKRVRSKSLLEGIEKQGREKEKYLDSLIHDFSKTKVRVYKNQNFPMLNDAAFKSERSSNTESIIIPGKIFPTSKFYKFLRIKIHELWVRHEYSSYLRIGSGFDVKQIKVLRTDDFISDTICQEIFWTDFSKKYGGRRQYQDLLNEFEEYLQAGDTAIDVQSSCRKFFNKMLKNIVNRNKRITLSRLKEEDKAVMGYLLLTCNSDIFSFRKKLKITSGSLKSLIRSRARLKI